MRGLGGMHTSSFCPRFEDWPAWCLLGEWHVGVASSVATFSPPLYIVFPVGKSSFISRAIRVAFSALLLYHQHAGYYIVKGTNDN